jgi:PAS domain S-box-containing protein
MEAERDFINFVRRGWIEVGGARMSLVEIKGGFYGMREVFAQEVGETDDDLVCRSGFQGSTSFMTSAMEANQITADEDGFRSAVDTYSQAGFGNFEVAELFWSRGWAIIRCNDSFEGWAYVQNQNLQSRPKCDYSRGVLLAFMSETHRQARTGIGELSVAENKCIGRGDEQCEFVIGTQADLESFGCEVPPPRVSIREKLERSIALLRDSNKRLMKTEMQYRSLFDVTFDAIVVVDRMLNVLNCNRPAERFLDIERNAIVGRKMLEYLPPDRGASLEEKVQEAAKLNERVDFNSDVLTSRGESKPCHVRVCPIYGEFAIVFHEAKEEAQK